MSTDKLTSRIIETTLVTWRQLKPIQPAKFKEQSDFDKQKLKASFLKNGFVAPFVVWKDNTGELWCLDGKHRLDILHELVKENHQVPEQLPATFISCKNKKEAAKLVLIYSSAYATISNSSFIDFIQNFELDFSALREEVSIGSVDFSEVDFLLNPIEEELIRNRKDKPNTIRITFTSFKQMEQAQPEIETLLKKYEGAIFSLSSGEV